MKKVLDYSKIIHFSKKQFSSYWYQINEIITKNPENILEIGIGFGSFISDYLKKRNYNIITMDIDEKLNPDKIGSVLNIPFSSKSFDIVTCFEVLEHLPFYEFTKALLEFRRVSRYYVILSLPDMTFYFKFKFSIDRHVEVLKIISIPFIKIGKKFCEHYWEIGFQKIKLSLIKENIKNAGFIIQKDYRIFENPYHHFFILTIRKDQEFTDTS